MSKFIKLFFGVILIIFLFTTLAHRAKANIIDLFSEIISINEYENFEVKKSKPEHASIIAKAKINFEEILEEGESLKSIYFQINDIDFYANRKKLISYGKDKFTWIGKIDGDYFGKIVLTINRNTLSAVIYGFGKKYSIHKIPDGIHIIKEYLNSSTFNKNDFLRPQFFKKSQPQALNAMASTYGESGNVVDVMVLYTAAADAASSDISTEILNALADANSAFSDSCANIYLRLVNSAQTTYNESGSSYNDLYSITYTEPAITTARTTQGADLVHLIVASMDSGISGIAWAPTTSNFAGGPIPSAGFSISLVGYTSFTHEIGHNFGLAHDRYQEDAHTNTTPAYAEGYGYSDLVNEVRTIMSYSRECTYYGLSCPRIGYFSNPRILYKGLPLGVPNNADSVSRLLAHKEAVANWAQAVTSLPNPTFSTCKAHSEEISSLDSCFIASAAFNSPLAKEVIYLRIFRDRILKKTAIGRTAIDLYYQFSPPLAKLIKGNPWAKPIIRIFLYPLVMLIKFPLLIILLLLIGLTLTVFFKKQKVGY